MLSATRTFQFQVTEMKVVGKKKNQCIPANCTSQVKCTNACKILSSFSPLPPKKKKRILGFLPVQMLTLNNCCYI